MAPSFTKPPPGIQVNWSHPQSRGLAQRFLFNEFARTPAGIVSSVRTSIAGSGTEPTPSRADNGSSLFVTGKYLDAGTDRTTADLALAPFTILARVLPVSAMSGGWAERSDGNTVNAGWIFGGGNGNVGILIERATTTYKLLTNTGQLTAGVWAWVAATFSGVFDVTDARNQVWVNGQAKAQALSINGSGAQGSDLTQSLRIGSNSFILSAGISNASTWNGNISDIAFYRRCFTQSEILAYIATPYAGLGLPSTKFFLFAAPPGVIAGTGDITIGAPSIDGSGTVDVSGIGSITIGGPAVDGVGSVNPSMRVTQSGAEIFGLTEDPLARVTHVGLEVLGETANVARVTTSGVETFGEAGALARITTTGLEVFGVARIPIPFVNAEVLIGITWIIITTRTGAVYVFSDRPLPDRSVYYYGWKEPRVIAWGKITRALSNVLTGQYENAVFTADLDDSDRLMRQLDEDRELIGATVIVHMISDVGRRAEQTPWTAFRGIITEASPTPTLRYSLAMRDPYAEQLRTHNPPPMRLFNTADHPNCALDKVPCSAENYRTSASALAGVSAIAVTGGDGVFAGGAQVAFSSHLTVYTIGTGGIDDPAVSINFSPALTANVASGEVITVLPTFTVQPAVGQRVPVPYGLITDRHLTAGADDGDGQGPCVYAGDRVLADGRTYGEFIWSAAACYTPLSGPFQMLYFWNNPLEAPGTVFYGAVPVVFADLTTEADAGGRIALPGYGNWDALGFTASFIDINGRRYTRLFLRGIFRDWALGIIKAPDYLGGVPFAVNAYGCEDIGNSTGALIENGILQYLHVLQNWIPAVGDCYQSGAWLTTPLFPDGTPMINEASFVEADAQSAVYVDGGFQGNFILGVNNDQTSARDLAAGLNRSFGLQSGFNNLTQYHVRLRNTDLDTVTLADPLGYERDIFTGTFSIEATTRELFTALKYWHTPDYAKRDASGWRSGVSGVTETENEGATDDYGQKTTYQTYTMPMVRGKNRDIDADDYERGSETAAAVLALVLGRVSRMQHLPQFGTGPGGFAYELGDMIPVTEYEGLTTAGWIDQPVYTERMEVDPSQFVSALEGYAINLLPSDITITGSGAIIIDAPTVDGTGGVGSVTITGTGAVAFAGPAVQGDENITGTGDIAFAGPAVAGAGTEEFTGTADITIDAPSVLASDGTITGEGDITFAGPAVQGAGTMAVVGTGSFAFAGPAVDGIGGALEVSIFPGDNAQGIVNAHAAGTTFRFRTGTHREQSIAPRAGDIYRADPATVLNGSRVLSTWTFSSPYWFATGQTQNAGTYGVMESGYEGNAANNQVFYDDVALRHMSSLAAVVASGQWFFDHGANRIYIRDNPSGHTIETSITSDAFQATADTVTVDGLIIEKYANSAQHGAIHANGRSDWTVTNCTVRLTHGLGIYASIDGIVTSNYVHHNGQMGINGTGGAPRVEDNEIAYNNAARFDSGWEAGGSKFTETDGYICRGNFSHHNRGPGLWGDINNINGLIEDNTAEDNDSPVGAPGIMWEISYACVIRNNFVRRNSLTAASFDQGSGILVSASPNVEVYGNTVEDNKSGIICIQQNRSGDPATHGPHETANLDVHDNTISGSSAITAGLLQDVGDTTYFSSRGNGFTSNTYSTGAVAQPFTWNNAYLDASGWASAGQS